MITVRTGSDFRYYLDATTEPTEDYYTGATRSSEPAGRWSGRGAAAVGLTGEVTALQMQALYGLRIDPRDDRFGDPAACGEAPTIGGPRRRYETADDAYERMLAAEPDAPGERREQLRLDAERSARANVQYLDVTFSVQKSISVLHVAFDRARVEADRAGREGEARAWAMHRDAVALAIWAGNAAALDYLQDEAGYSRIGHHGGAAGRWIDAHEWIVTSFFQHDSRDGDPQLHVHNPVLNLAQSADGRWRTLDSRGITRHRGAAGAIAERVTEEYLSRVLRVRFASRPDGKAREVVGIPPALVEALSTRARTLTPKAARLAAEFEARYGRPPNPLQLDRLKRQATLATRRPKAKTAESLADRGERIDALMRELEGDLRDGLAAVARSVPRLPEQPAPLAFSPAAAIETALAEVQVAKSTWTRPELVRAISNALPDVLGGLEAEPVRRLLDGLADEALAHPDVQQVGGEVDEDLPAVGELRLAGGISAYAGPAARTYALRSHIAGERAMATAALELGATAVDPAAAEAAVLALAEDGLLLGADQRQALIGVLTSGAKVETLVGPAGTGKSTVVGALARIWPVAGARADGAGHRVVGLAASQVATEVLADEGLPALNVARWLAVQQRLADGSLHAGDTAWRLAAGDLVVVDEAGTLRTADLIAVHRHATAAGAKLLLTGDHRQLAAVGAGGGMALLAGAETRELTDVRRFIAGWEGPASLRLRDGDDTVLHDYRRRGRLIDGGTREQARSSAARAWLADTLAGRQSVIVADTNEEAALLSAEVRAKLVRLGRVTDDGVALGRDGNTAGVGDLVQARRNGWELRGRLGNARAPINRETYRVAAIRADGGLVVEHVTGPGAGSPLTLPPKYVAADLTLGYAGTVHSAQGRTVNTAHVVAGQTTSRQALYVALTRGRDANHVHVITRSADESQPAGAVHAVPPADPLGVLARVLRDDGDRLDDTTAAAQGDLAEARRTSMQTAVERFAAEAEMVYTARTTTTLDRLTADGTLTGEQRLALSADPHAVAVLGRLLRTVELAGHDPDQVLSAAVRQRDLGGARSIAQVLHRRITDRYGDRLTPAATSYTDMVPAVPSAGWREQLTRRAEAANGRRRYLGEQAANDRPQWAVQALGSVPAEPVARLEWEHCAGTIAAWRELADHRDAADALGPAPAAGKPEHHAAWHAAWTALGRPETTRQDAELSNGQLRIRVRALEREENWAPPYVGEALAATTLRADARSRDAHMLHAHALATTDPALAGQLRRDAAHAGTEAEALTRLVDQLTEVDRARSRWLAHTAVTRDAAERARAELAARGAPVGAEPDAVAPSEWLAAHTAETAEADRHRRVAGEHDLADVVRQRSADLGPLTQEANPTTDDGRADAREGRAVDFVDQRGRIPSVAEAEAAVRQAQHALREIGRRRPIDERHTIEEARTRQLAQWVDDDSSADVAEVLGAGR